jgi:hypothetical protein
VRDLHVLSDPLCDIADSLELAGSRIVSALSCWASRPRFGFVVSQRVTPFGQDNAEGEASCKRAEIPS